MFPLFYFSLTFALPHNLNRKRKITFCSSPIRPIEFIAMCMQADLVYTFHLHLQKQHLYCNNCWAFKEMLKRTKDQIRSFELWMHSTKGWDYETLNCLWTSCSIANRRSLPPHRCVSSWTENLDHDRWETIFMLLTYTFFCLRDELLVKPRLTLVKQASHTIKYDQIRLIVLACLIRDLEVWLSLSSALKKKKDTLILKHIKNFVLRCY